MSIRKMINKKILKANMTSLFPPPCNHSLNYRYLRCALLLMMITGLAFPIASEAQQQTFNYRITRGLDVEILKNPEIPFIHAELVIYYREKPINPAIPYLTILNIFDKNVKFPDNPVLNSLQRLGNDFEIELRPDYFLFKINFLTDKIPQFIRFLKNLYNFKDWLEESTASTTYFTHKPKTKAVERFNDSISNYWKLFFKKPDWKKNIAYQLAYHHFFAGSILGETLITPEHLKVTHLNLIRSFYLGTYLLTNSRLIMKGNIENPAFVYGTLERAFTTGKKAIPGRYPDEGLAINNRRKIYVFNTQSNEMPTIFWFEPITTSKNKSPILALILNNILFGFPNGRIYNAISRMVDVGALRIQSEIINHKGVSVMCNTIRIKTNDIEKFILQAEREKKKLTAKNIERNETLDTGSNIFGRLKVNTQDIGNEINMELGDIPDTYPQVSMASLNKETETFYNPVIVIMGNGKLITEALSSLANQVEVVDFH